MATYKERLEFLIERGAIGIDTVNLNGMPQKVFYFEATEVAIPPDVETVEEAIDWAIKVKIGGTSE